MHLKRFFLCLLASALSFTSLQSHAWRIMEGCAAGWPGTPATMKFITAGLPVGNPLRTATESQINEWNLIPSSRVLLTSLSDDENTVSPNNNENEVYLADLGGQLLGTTHRRCKPSSPWNLLEADVLFRTTPDLPWSTAQPASAAQLTGGGVYFFHPVGTHELGHALALNHENSVTAVMNAIYPFHGFAGDIRQRRWWIGADDQLGARALYPGTPVSAKDIVPTSVRAFTDGTGGANPHAWFPETVSRGSLIGIEHGYENTGTVSLTFEVGLYLSTDRAITTSDYYLGSHFPQNVPPGRVDNWAFQFIVPFSVPPGPYFVGFIVDPSNQHSELSEGIYNSMDLGPVTVQ